MNNIYEMSGFIEDNEYKDDLNGAFYCNLCEKNSNKFLPIGIRDDFFEQNNVIGGGYRENARCPKCRSIDRNRWVYKILKDYTDIFIESCCVLHFAPELIIAKKIKENYRCDYYPADLNFRPNVHRVDVTNIPYKDEMFDYVIINHVLEHVLDEKKAISELKRVLKPNGKIVMSFPIALNRLTFSNDEIVTEEDRLKNYGQADHVRLYGRDCKEHFEKYGLKMKSYSPIEYLTEEEIRKNCFIHNDMVFIAEFVL